MPECIECAYCRVGDECTSDFCERYGHITGIYEKACKGFSKEYKFEETVKYRMLQKIDEKK